LKLTASSKSVGRSFDRQIGGLCTLQNVIDVAGRATEQI